MNKKTSIIASVSVCICILSFVAYIVIERDMKEIISETSVIQIEVKNIEAKSKELDSLQQNIGSTLSERDRLLTVFLAEDGTVDFIDSLESIAKNLGVKFTVKTITQKEESALTEANKGLVVFSSSVEGSWNDIAHFLIVIENLPYKSFVETVLLSSKVAITEDGKEGDPFWEGGITFSIVNTK